MPRQPFLPQYAKKELLFGVGHVERLNEIALRVGKCAMLWSHAELQLALLLSQLIGATAEPATAIFLALKNSRAQRDVLMAAGEYRLSGEELHVFHAIMNIYKALESQRNDVVHGIYGRCDAIQDGAIWIESKACAKAEIDILKEIRANPQRDINLQQLKQNAFVYKTADLDKLIGEIGELWRAAFNLWQVLRTPQNTLAQQVFHSTHELPLIKRELTRSQKP